MSSNAGSNRKPGTFVKGDPRINRKGRPKSFDALRKLAQQISHEQTVAKDGEPVTRIEELLRKWVLSADVRVQMKFVEIAFGNAPQPVEVTGKGGDAIQVHFVDYRAGLNGASETKE